MSDELIKRIGRAYLTGGLSELRRAAAKTGAPVALLPLTGPTGALTGFNRKPPGKPVNFPAAVSKATGGGRPDITRGPKGWLALLAQHGGMCLFYELHYLKAHLHVSPINCIHWSRWENNGDLDVDYSRSTLMCNRFPETQSPLWDYMAPVMWNDRTPGPTSHDWWQAAGVMATINGGSPKYVNQVSARRPYPNEVTGKLGGHVGDNFNGYLWQLAPAQLVLDWYDRTSGLSHATKGRIRTAGFDVLNQYKLNKFTPTAYWAESDQRRVAWSMRMIRWMDTAQWFVWACEMVRLHHYDGRYKPCPDYWRRFCNAWGIAVPEYSTQASRETYAERARSKNDKAYLSLELEGMHWELWKQISWAVMREAGYPGEPDFCGKQIAPDDHWLSVFDMPKKCGTLVPPAMLINGEINYGLLNLWGSKQNFESAWEQVVGIWNALGNTVLSFTGVAELQAAMSAIQTSLAAVTQVIGAVYKLSSGGSVSMSDIQDILGNIYELTAGIANLTGVDVGEMIPDGTWEALTTAGAAIPAFGGDLANTAHTMAVSVRNELIDLRDSWKWDYLDEGFSTLVSATV